MQVLSCYSHTNAGDGNLILLLLLLLLLQSLFFCFVFFFFFIFPYCHPLFFGLHLFFCRVYGKGDITHNVDSGGQDVFNWEGKRFFKLYLLP